MHLADAGRRLPKSVQLHPQKLYAAKVSPAQFLPPPSRKPIGLAHPDRPLFFLCLPPRTQRLRIRGDLDRAWLALRVLSQEREKLELAGRRGSEGGRGLGDQAGLPVRAKL